MRSSAAAAARPRPRFTLRSRMKKRAKNIHTTTKHRKNKPGQQGIPCDAKKPGRLKAAQRYSFVRRQHFQALPRTFPFKERKHKPVLAMEREARLNEEREPTESQRTLNDPSKRPPANLKPRRRNINEHLPKQPQE